MTKCELIEKLQASMREEGDRTLTVMELIGLAFGEHQRREHEARAKIILQIVRAKTDAGFRRDCVFFTDVWPKVLEAYKEREIERTGPR
jgi:hypothetical protein